MQQETQYQDQQPQTSLPTTQTQQYTTHISELISEPAANNVYAQAAQYILSSLYQLSSYLFTKKVAENNGHSQYQMNENQLSFNSYLQLMQQDLGKFQKIRTLKKSDISMQKLSMESELVKCYQKVEGIYFQENYVLDLSYFEYFYLQLKNRQKKGKNNTVNTQIQKLCQSLDLVQINLFSQIHCKFQEYFKVVANFQYLKESVSFHLAKLKASRKAINKVKSNFIDKSVILRKKIIQRQNIEKTLKLIKQIKSIKKLPQVLQSILSSSLPYQSLSLLQDTKSTIESLKQLRCLKNTSQSVKNMESLVQNDLTKRYANQLYLYLQECHNRDSNNLKELWKKIEVNTCLDKDSSFVLDQLNSSTNSAFSDNPQLLEEIELMDTGSQFAIAQSSLMPRHEGKQYEIAMILIQSYKYVSFSPEVTKIKVCNALRMFSKRFQKELLIYLNQVVTNEIENIKEKEKQVQASQEANKEEKNSQVLEKKQSQQNESALTTVVEKVSVQFYIKHLGILNQIFKETINRFLGYLLTLVTQYEQEYNNECNSLSQNEKLKLKQSHQKFRDIFQEQCSLLPSIFKIIQQKIKYLLTLKNISNIDCLQFYRWITILRYWQKFLDHLIQFHPLLNHEAHGPAEKPVEDLISVVTQNIKKSIQVMGLQGLLYELTVDYINVYHNNTLNNQIINTLQEDTWQSTQIPAEFGDILQAIFNPDGNALNSSITILDSSTNSSKGILNMSREKQMSRGQQTSAMRGAKVKIKLLKNNILIGGVRYKVNLSFLILCQLIGQYMKLARILSNVLQKKQNQICNKITAFVYQKIYNLIEVYCQKSKELIIDTKALSYGKIKGKTINAKHICLLSNCLSVVQRIAQEMFDNDKLQILQLSQSKKNAIVLLQSTRGQLINKLTSILYNKTQKEIKDFLEQEKLNPQQSQASNKTSNIIISSFLQMVEITDEYLQVEGVRQVLKSSFQALSQKYLTHLLLKGGRQRAEVEVLIERLKFLRKYFPTQYQTLLKQIPS